MRNRKSTCLYIDWEVLETAREMGLNLSRVSENALKEAIGRLGGWAVRKRETRATGWQQIPTVPSDHLLSLRMG